MASMTLPVTPRWILGEPTEHPINDSEQGFDDWYDFEGRAFILRYRDGFEIIELHDAGGRSEFTVPWMHHEYSTRDLEDAELWLAEQVARDGSIVAVTL